MSGGVMIAATQSGVGKTSVSIALARALARRGLKVAAFKTGPDFLDPTYLSIASGAQCHNLDGWMMGAEYSKKLFARKSAAADIALVEGAMGLFDGASASSIEGSSAEIAALTGVPVLLVVNTRGMARSVAPMVKGFAEFDPAIKIGGVIANMSGSAGHAKLLAESLKSAGLPPLVGALPGGAFPALSSRHLGLVSADGNILDDAIMDQMAEAIERHVDIDAIIKIAADAAPAARGDDEELCAPVEKARLGAALDEAFHFYYADTMEALEKAGIETVEFSPIRDEKLPENISGLYFGGGYPEIHAGALSRNQSMIESVREFAAAGRPVYAECGGLMYLSESIKLLDGTESRMCGVLPFGVRMLERRKMLGYVEAVLMEDSLWGGAGEAFRGHEFHYSEIDGEFRESGEWRNIYTMTTRRTGAAAPDGFTNGNVVAAYAHLHFASSQGAASALYKSLSKGGC